MGASLYVVMCTWVQEPREARGIGPPGAGVMGRCELPDMGARTWRSLQEQCMHLTAEQSLRPLSQLIF